jgi:hypothetical protein
MISTVSHDRSSTLLHVDHRQRGGDVDCTVGVDDSDK